MLDSASSSLPPHRREPENLGILGEGEPYFWMFSLYPLTQRPILFCLLFAEEAEQLARQSDQQTVEGMMDVLRRCFGPDIPEPVSSRVTHWEADPFSLGSYSIPRMGSSGLDFGTLAEPVGDRLFFAGEATEFDFQGCVHGAYFSGLREAERLIGMYSPDSPVPAGESEAASSSA
jgi:monoamine oxidase